MYFLCLHYVISSGNKWRVYSFVRRGVFRRFVTVFTGASSIPKLAGLFISGCHCIEVRYI